MSVLRIPTPLRPYAGGAERIEIKATTVAGALEELVAAHPELKPHLFNEQGELRAFVNVFVNEDNMRDLRGVQTPIGQDDSLMILPSIAGGADGLQNVDHAALRTNQAIIIGLSILAYILDAAWQAGVVALVMLLGTLFQAPGFGFVYRGMLKPLGWVKPDVLADNPEPHRFAQGFGAVVQGLGYGLLLGGSAAGWALVWLVVALAALNLFGGFCVGCAMYYWLQRLKVPGFVKAPPPGAIPGAKPKDG